MDFFSKSPICLIFFKLNFEAEWRSILKLLEGEKEEILSFQAKEAFFSFNLIWKKDDFFQNPFLLLNITSLRTLLSFNIALRFNLEKNILRNP